MTPNAIAKAVPMDECKILLAQRLLFIGRGQEQIYVPRVRTYPPRITFTDQQESSGSPQNLHAPGQVPHSSVFPTGFTHYCLEMITIKFPLTISSINCHGQLEI